MLLNSIKKAMEGHHVFSEKVYQHLITRHQTKDPLFTLTRRECEILHEITAGLKIKKFLSYYLFQRKPLKFTFEMF